jgi:hypothetical protein
LEVKKITSIGLFCLLLSSCSEKEKLATPPVDAFPVSQHPLPVKLTGTWVRTTSLRTFDYKPEEWVAEPKDSTAMKRIQINAGKTFISNQIACSNCAVELVGDTLYLQHAAGYYKFPVMALNDTLLYLKTKTAQTAYSLPNTGLFDYILEEKYRKLK